MAQTYQDKPSLAAWNALGGWEKIKEAEFTTDWTTSFAIDVSDVDWNDWSVAVLTASKNPESCSANIISDGIAASTGTTSTTDVLSEASLMDAWFIAMFPMRNAEQNMRVYNYTKDTFFNERGLLYRGLRRFTITRVNGGSGSMRQGFTLRLWGMR